MALAIGFTEQYYTLWDVMSFTESVNEFVERDVVRLAYQKNISKDIDKVKALYPNFDEVFDATLRGHSEVRRYGAVRETNEDKFNYGRYKGEFIADCHDSSYMAWFYNEGNSEARLKCLENTLSKFGYHFEDNKAYSEDEWAVRLAEKTRYNELKATLESGAPIEVEISSNLSLYTENEIQTASCRVEIDEIAIGLYFNHYSVMYYNGYEYGLPTIKGKAKRIKNKNIRLTEYKLKENKYGWLEIEVENFEIIKNK